MPARRAAAPLAAAVLVSALSGAPHARAQSAAEETCRQHYERAQELRVTERPLAARAELDACVSSCVEALREDCVRWQAEVAGEIPRLLVVVVDAEGRLVQGARLRVDGHDLPAASAGGPLELETGKHRVEAHTAGATASAQVELARGAVQQVRLQVVPAEPSRPQTAPSTGGAELWTVGGIGLAAAVVGGVLIVAGHAKNAADEDACAETVQMPGHRAGCTRTEADELSRGTERLWIAGGITAGAGVALVAAAALGLSLRAPARTSRGQPSARVRWHADAAGHPGLAIQALW